MRILYIHQYFVTPHEAGGTRSYWISKELIKNGHEVTMITTRRNKDHRKIPRILNIDGINVIYFDIPYSNNMGLLQRLFAFIKFMVKSSLITLTEKKFDLIIATSTPLTVGLPALIGKKVRRTPYLFEVRDLWPEVPIQMGAIKNRIIIAIAKWFEKKIYKNANHIVSLSPGMFQGVIDTGIPTNKVTTIPNMSKIDKFWPREKNVTLTKELGLGEDSFKVVYFGSMGLTNGMDYIIDAAKVLNNTPELEFIFIGGGSKEPDLRLRCQEEGIKNVHFYGGMSMDKLSEIVNISDVSLVTFADLPILATNSPNKLFDSLSAGKPVIVNSPGWTKDMVEEYNCGVFVNPKNPQDLVDKLTWLQKHPEILLEMGQNSRKLAENRFDKSILCKRFTEIVSSI